MKRFSIIIPVREINDYIRKFVPIIMKQEYPKENYEIIILPNDETKEKIKGKNIRIIPSGNVGPAQKRDLGAKKAKGKILAFIDDDAYPGSDWLRRAEEHFDDSRVAGIGGPQLTPKESNFFQRTSGEVLASRMVSGNQSYRYKPRGEVRENYDLPSCNLFIRKEVFLKLGGFNTGFWPGEDTKLCLEIKKSGKKIMYDPEMIVYHHRRKNIKEYIKQICTYAKHRGYFAKRFPETSRRIAYFIPSLFLLGLIIGGAMSIINQKIRIVYLGIIIIYLLLLLIEALKSNEKRYFLEFIILSFTTHITYGIGIITGLLKKELKSKYRR